MLFLLNLQNLKERIYSNNRGEWVNAGFDGSDGTYNEWYQVEDGKIIAWSQTKGDISID